MNTHVFIVNEQTFKCHLEYMFAGTGAGDKRSPFLYNASAYFNASSERNLVGMIADISRIQRIDILIKQETCDKIHFKVIELKDEQPTADIVDRQLNWYIKWLFDYVVPNYSKKAVEITPCIIAAKTNDSKLIQHFAEKKFKNPYAYSSIKKIEYYSFKIGNDNICFERVL